MLYCEGERYGPGLSRALQSAIRVLVSPIPGDLRQQIQAVVPRRVHRAAEVAGLHYVAKRHRGQIAAMYYSFQITAVYPERGRMADPKAKRRICR